MPTLLLVADDVWVRNNVAAAVTEPNMTLETLDDPEGIAEVLSRGLYDAVLVDLQVANLGGMAITHLIRDAVAAGRVSRVPVIMLLDRSADAFLARRAGADAHLNKPITAQDLRTTLAAFQPAGA